MFYDTFLMCWQASKSTSRSSRARCTTTIPRNASHKFSFTKISLRSRAARKCRKSRRCTMCPFMVNEVNGREEQFPTFFSSLLRHPENKKEKKPTEIRVIDRRSVERGTDDCSSSIACLWNEKIKSCSAKAILVKIKASHDGVTNIGF